MGRRWLGMSNEDYLQMPHADAAPESLWWYGQKRADSRAVIDSYLSRYKRGAALPKGRRDELLECLRNLSQIQSLARWGRPGTKRYWTIPNYARANGHNRFTLMKWLRELEKVAKEMYPERAAVHGRNRKLTEAELEDIRTMYVEGVSIKDIAPKFGITRAHVGRLCDEDTKRKRAEYKASRSEDSPAPETSTTAFFGGDDLF